MKAIGSASVFVLAFATLGLPGCEESGDAVDNNTTDSDDPGTSNPDGPAAPGDSNPSPDPSGDSDAGSGTDSADTDPDEDTDEDPDEGDPDAPLVCPSLPEDPGEYTQDYSDLRPSDDEDCGNLDDYFFEGRSLPTGCFTRCEPEFEPEYDECYETPDCNVDDLLDNDETPSVQATLDGDEFDLDCGSCTALQYNSCYYYACPDTYPELDQCAQENADVVPEPGEPGPCDALIPPFLACLGPNLGVVFRCQSIRTPYCFGRTPMEGME